MRAPVAITARGTWCHCRHENEGIRSCEDTGDDVVACHSGFYCGTKSHKLLEGHNPSNDRHDTDVTRRQAGWSGARGQLTPRMNITDDCTCMARACD
jgi:hypothetical protein